MNAQVVWTLREVKGKDHADSLLLLKQAALMLS